MHVTDSERLESLINDSSPQQNEFIMFLSSYNPNTGIASVGSGVNTTTINVLVTPRMRAFPKLLKPGVRVLIKKIGTHPLVLTDVLKRV